MLAAIAPPAADKSQLDLLGDIFQGFIAADGVADALLDVALVSQLPPLDALERRFDALDFDRDRDTLPVDFRQASSP